MDIITYALCKKIAASAVSGIADMIVDGTTLTIITNDGNSIDIHFPTPADGVSIVDVKLDQESRHLFCKMSDHTEIDAGYIPIPVKGIDYFTEEDKNEMEQEIITEITGSLVLYIIE